MRRRPSARRDSALYNALRPRTKVLPTSGYYVLVLQGGRHAYAPRLADAKKIGAQLAKQEARRVTKWFSPYGYVRIYKMDNQGKHNKTVWKMNFQLPRKTVRLLSDVEFKRSYGHAPYKWFKDTRK
jgi:hypothetical protein